MKSCRLGSTGSGDRVEAQRAGVGKLVEDTHEGRHDARQNGDDATAEGHVGERLRHPLLGEASLFKWDK